MFVESERLRCSFKLLKNGVNFSTDAVFSLKTCGFFLRKRQTGPGWSGELIRIDRLSGVSYLFIYVIREPDGYALDHLVFSFIVQLLRTTIVLLCLHLMGVAGWEWHCQA